MRNIFDQYTQPENRLTHALASTLANDRKLLRPFLKWLEIESIPPLKTLKVAEQMLPGDAEISLRPGQIGLPDACIYDEEGWAVLFECKVQSAVELRQLLNHRRTAAARGYQDAPVVLIASKIPKRKWPEWVYPVEWKVIYSWFGKQTSSFWARQLVAYMRVFEARAIADDYNLQGTITMFDGFHFDENNPYGYPEAKRLIRLLRQELCKRKELKTIGGDPKGKGRSAITGKGSDRVWDYIPLKAARKAKSFTDFPHLTMSINSECIAASVTVPNGVKGGFRSKLLADGPDGLEEVLYQILKNLRPLLKKPIYAEPWVYLLQRHYLGQQTPVVDAKMEADLRAVLDVKNNQGIKYQPYWLDAIYGVLSKKESNLQLGLEVYFYYDCHAVQSTKVLDLFCQSWLACKPLLDLLDKKNRPPAVT